MSKLNIRNRNKDKYDKGGKLKAANWEYRFEAAKIDGKRKSISKAGFKTKKEAEIEGTKALSEYNSAGLKFEPSKMSYSDYIDFWLESYAKTSVKEKSYENYERIVRLHLKDAFSNYRLCAITPMIIQEYVNDLYKAGYKKTTLAGIMSVMKESFSYAVVPCQFIQNSPCDHIKTPNLSYEREEASRYVISKEDYEKILERFPEGNPYRYAIIISYYTGLRIGEVYGLTWEDVDFKNMTISVNKQIVKRNHGIPPKRTEKELGKKDEKSVWYLADPKTKSSKRTIKIGHNLVDTLKEYKKIQLENKMHYGEYWTEIYKKEEKDNQGNKVFRLIEAEKSIPVDLPCANMIMKKECGHYSSYDSFKYASRIIRKELKLDFNFHSIRHTHATMLIESGVSPKAVQERLGHSDIKTTFQNYVHNTDSMEQAAVDTFDRIMTTKNA